ncbi:hypothetical protein NC653_040224 [Populus alba x Populus x berolinensis]|uniref:Uncharacterized protein n=1 Tax=Populus alba x Populus x berolinensis TaxID=444605 RepID=A0AAD6LDC2_9ROSI|nr:hypothetical protein NC653_040224 [Populus alba x Populus x berolinensis]
MHKHLYNALAEVNKTWFNLQLLFAKILQRWNEAMKLNDARLTTSPSDKQDKYSQYHRNSSIKYRTNSTRRDHNSLFFRTSPSHCRLTILYFIKLRNKNQMKAHRSAEKSLHLLVKKCPAINSNQEHSNKM